MNDVQPPRPARSALLRTSVLLFALFLVQAGYQAYHANRVHVDVDTDLSAELADATFLEDEAAAESAGWPQWRGPRRDGFVQIADLSTDWPQEGPPLLWRKPLALGYSSFAVHKGRLYSLFQEGEQEVIACWRVEDGEELWRHPYDCSAKVKDYPGPRSTPTLDGDRLYTVGSGGKLLCLNAATGSPYWQKDLLADFHASAPTWGVAFSPLIDGELLFTSPGGPNGNSLVAFNKITGELVWKTLDEVSGYSSPIAATIAGTRQVIFFMGKSLVGVRASDGQLCWRYPWATSFEVNAATPLTFRARSGDRVFHYVFISSGYNKGCALLKIAPTASGGFEAKKVYSGKQLCSHFASPVRRGEYLFGIDDSRLTCLNLRNGKARWKQSSIYKGSLMRVNDSLLVLGEEGTLFLLDARAEKYQPKAEAHPFGRGDERCWTMPVVAEGRLFLRDEQEMKCFDLRKRH